MTHLLRIEFQLSPPDPDLHAAFSSQAWVKITIGTKKYEGRISRIEVADIDLHLTACYWIENAHEIR